MLPAKQIATIDAFHGGRFTLAAAVGWLRPEFDMLGVAYEQRGRDHRRVPARHEGPVDGGRARASGRHVQFSDIVFEPKCAQEPHVPIWVAGGSGRGPIERLLELGDGWMPMGGDTGSELRDTIARIKEQAAGRGPRSRGDHVPLHDRGRHA